MAQIYKITNLLNGKMYIGKTLTTIEERWKAHCKDATKERCNKRPFYDAINKYGKENFTIEEVEKCTDAVVNEREQYWIAFYDTFHNGYNATLGGDGSHYLDYDLIVETYKTEKMLKTTAEKLGICVDSVRKVLQERDIPINDAYIFQCLRVNMYDKQDNFIQIFNSTQEAAEFIYHQNPEGRKLDGMSSHISQVCKGSRKTAYGYKWKYAG